MVVALGAVAKGTVDLRGDVRFLAVVVVVEFGEDSVPVGPADVAGGVGAETNDAVAQQLVEELYNRSLHEWVACVDIAESE